MIKKKNYKSDILWQHHCSSCDPLMVCIFFFSLQKKKQTKNSSNSIKHSKLFQSEHDAVTEWICLGLEEGSRKFQRFLLKLSEERKLREKTGPWIPSSIWNQRGRKHLRECVLFICIHCNGVHSVSLLLSGCFCWDRTGWWFNYQLQQETALSSDCPAFFHVYVHDGLPKAQIIHVNLEMCQLWQSRLQSNNTDHW